MKADIRRATYALLIAIIMMLPTFPASSASAAAPVELNIEIDIPAAEGRCVPVRAEIDLPADLAKLPVERILATLTDSAGKSVSGQVDRDGDNTQLWWVLPEAAAGKSRWTVRLSHGAYAGKDTFSFRDKPGKYMDLLFADKGVTRYMYEYDASTPEKAKETNKVFTHVFDETGKDFITKGAGGHDPHHRGIFIGWSRLTTGTSRYGPKTRSGAFGHACGAGSWRDELSAMMDRRLSRHRSRLITAYCARHPAVSPPPVALPTQRDGNTEAARPDAHGTGYPPLLVQQTPQAQSVDCPSPDDSALRGNEQ